MQLLRIVRLTRVSDYISNNMSTVCEWVSYCDTNGDGYKLKINKSRKKNKFCLAFNVFPVYNSDH